jgi:hypothetical protein
MSPDRNDGYPVLRWQNAPPVVFAGDDIALKFPLSSVQLAGNVSDDGLPNGAVSFLWSIQSGPGMVSFAPDESNLDPVVNFSLPGVYVLRLTANDGELESYDEVTISYSYKVMFVDSSATGANTGSSWENAFVYLRDAVIVSTPGTEIRVAQGIYRPDLFSVLDRLSMGRIETFELKSGVILKGGYKGIKGISNIKYKISNIEDGRTASAPLDNGPDERDPVKYPTILSGDLSGNDNPATALTKLRTDPTRADNAYHILTALGADNTAVLDGFIITGGQADSAVSPGHRGGGLYLEHSTPTVSHCVFTRNYADMGGAVGTYVSSFPTFIDCRFESNSASGGGAVSNDSYSSFTGCAFTGNYGVNGGAFYTTTPSTLTGCLLAGNTAGNDGGGLYAVSMTTTLVNCTIADNTAQNSGVFSATVGGGVFSKPDSTVVVANSILWGNRACGFGGRIAQFFGGTQKITHSTVQDWHGRDPLFADPATGDYRLKSKAGRYDPATGNWIIDAVTSPAIDAGSPFDPVGAEPAPNGGRINQGFDGGTPQASKSPAQNIADLNHDGKVNLIDLAIVAENWLWEE